MIQMKNLRKKGFQDHVLSQEKKQLREAMLGQPNTEIDQKVTDLWCLSHLIKFYLQFRSVLFQSLHKVKEYRFKYVKAIYLGTTKMQHFKFYSFSILGLKLPSLQMY